MSYLVLKLTNKHAKSNLSQNKFSSDFPDALTCLSTVHLNEGALSFGFDNYEEITTSIYNLAF
jgi:hypothetical protein